MAPGAGVIKYGADGGEEEQKDSPRATAASVHGSLKDLGNRRAHSIVVCAVCNMDPSWSFALGIRRVF